MVTIYNKPQECNGPTIPNVPSQCQSANPANVCPSDPPADSCVASGTMPQFYAPFLLTPSVTGDFTFTVAVAKPQRAEIQVYFFTATYTRPAGVVSFPGPSYHGIESTDRQESDRNND